MFERLMHPSPRRLLLYADGELTSAVAARLRDHLAGCVGCAERLRRIEAASNEVAVAYRDEGAENADIDIGGPRALLRARMTELALSSAPRRQRQLRFARNLAYISALAILSVIGVGLLRQHRSPAATYSGLLPDPGITPGSTRQASLTELCRLDHEEVVRAVPDALQQRVFHEYGLTGARMDEFEVDYLITPGLGGSDDVRNLWPQPHSNVWNSYVKDQLEDHLHRMVCDGSLNLKDAQRDIAGNWIAAYKKYFHTEMPVSGPLHAERIALTHPRFALLRKQPVA